MNSSPEKKILEKISFVRKNKKIPQWPSSLFNAKLALKNARFFDSVFEMLAGIIFFQELCLYKKAPPGLNQDGIPENPEGFSCFDLEMFPFYQTNLSQSQYYNALLVSKFTYYEFIASAILFLIENSLYKKENMRSVVYCIATYTSGFALRKDSFSIQISFFLQEICLFNYFPKPSLSVFIPKLDNIVGRVKINKNERYGNFYLSFFSFYFSSSFINECMKDCQIETNISPLVLALRMYEILLLTDDVEGKKLKIQSLEYFKRDLIKKKLITSDFIFHCNKGIFQDGATQRKFSTYYSCFKGKFVNKFIKKNFDKSKSANK